MCSSDLKEKVRFLGLDVHAETIAVAIAEPDGEVRSLGMIANRVDSIRKLVKKLGAVDQLQARHRLSKFLLRTGQRPAAGVKSWTQPYMAWVKQVHFAQVAREATLLDYLHEVS